MPKMPTIIERLTNLENLVRQIQLYIEKRFLNGLPFEDAMAGLYREIRAKEIEMEQDPDRNFPGKKYSLPQFDELELTLSDETVDPGSPQSGYRSPSSGTASVDSTGTDLSESGKYNLSPRSPGPSSRGGALKRRKKKGKKRRTNRR